MGEDEAYATSGELCRKLAEILGIEYSYIPKTRN